MDCGPLGAMISISACSWAAVWEEFKAAWTSCGKSGKVSSTWATMMSHHPCTWYGKGFGHPEGHRMSGAPIAADGCHFIIGSGAIMEGSLAKLGDMAAPKGKVPFMATWWAKGAFCQFDHGLVGFNLVLLGLLLVGNFNGHTGLDLLQIWSNGKDHGTFLVAVMVGQHGPTSVLGVHQELGWLQGLLVQQTILLELVLDLLPLGPDGQHGVILDLGDGFLELLVHGSNQEAEDMDNGDTCMSCLAWSTILLPACLPSWGLHGLACILAVKATGALAVEATWSSQLKDNLLKSTVCSSKKNTCPCFMLL